MKMTSIFVIFILPITLNLDVEQLDVRTTFLYGDLKENMYLEQLEVFKDEVKEYLVL